LDKVSRHLSVKGNPIVKAFGHENFRVDQSFATGPAKAILDLEGTKTKGETGRNRLLKQVNWKEPSLLSTRQNNE
jgi:hypothetical protein